MLGVSHFSETLLEAVENELTVSALPSYFRTKLNPVLSRRTRPQT